MLCTVPPHRSMGESEDIMYVKTGCINHYVCTKVKFFLSVKQSWNANTTLTNSGTFLSLSHPNPPLQLKPFSHHCLLSRNRRAIGHLSNAGDLWSHTLVCLSVGEIIKFLSAFFLGPMFEAFNYFSFYKDSLSGFSPNLWLIFHDPRS